MNLFGSIKKKKELKEESKTYVSWILTDRQLCDIELILNGGFSPLKGFLNKIDYQSVVKRMRLNDGTLWPMPINLDITEEFALKIKNENKITLRDKEGFPLAILTIEDIWRPDFKEESSLVYNTLSEKHPGVDYLLNTSHKIYLGGVLEGISLPHHYDYSIYRHTPDELKSLFSKLKWNKIIAFQTRNPLHRAHVEMTMSAIKEYQAKLLIHPVIGMTKAGDINHYVRVRCYEHVMSKYQKDTALMSLLPLAMRMAGPREALWHALIRKNFGCTHLIIGRDHAGPGKDENGKLFYGAYDSQQLLLKYQDEVKIKMIPFKFMVYINSINDYKPIDEISKGTKFNTISGTMLRNFLDEGKKIPSWFTYPEVSKELQLSIPPINKRGCTIFFTGLSGSGKSTLANGLMVKFLENGFNRVSLLDGDIVRTHLSTELGFSKEHRSINVRRIGYVASEITKNRGIAICAPIAPYANDRRFNRKLISSLGNYVQIFVNTSLEKCEERDVKGLYALARKGIIKKFTGISDPYEKPESSEIIVNSSGKAPEKIVDSIFNKIRKMGFID